MHYRENFVCLTRLIEAAKVTGFSFFLIRKATRRRKPKERFICMLLKTSITFIVALNLCPSSQAFALFFLSNDFME